MDNRRGVFHFKLGRSDWYHECNCRDFMTEIKEKVPGRSRAYSKDMKSWTMSDHFFERFLELAQRFGISAHLSTDLQGPELGSVPLGKQRYLQE
jgi:hypothetical protein